MGGEIRKQDSGIGQIGITLVSTQDRQFSLDNLSPKAMNRLLAGLKTMKLPDRISFLHQLDLKARAGDPKALQAQIDILNSKELSQASGEACRIMLEQRVDNLDYHSITSEISLFMLHLATSSDSTLANHMDDRLGVVAANAQNQMNNQANLLKDGIKNERSPRYIERMEKELSQTVTYLGDLKDLQNAIGQTAAPFVTSCLRNQYELALSGGKQPEYETNRFDPGKKINFRSAPPRLETRTSDESPKTGGFSLKKLFSSFHLPKISFTSLKDKFVSFFSPSSEVRSGPDVKIGHDLSEESLSKLAKKK